MAEFMNKLSIFILRELGKKYNQGGLQKMLQGYGANLGPEALDTVSYHVGKGQYVLRAQKDYVVPDLKGTLLTEEQVMRECVKITH